MPFICAQRGAVVDFMRRCAARYYAMRGAAAQRVARVCRAVAPFFIDLFFLLTIFLSSFFFIFMLIACFCRGGFFSLTYQFHHRHFICLPPAHAPPRHAHHVVDICPYHLMPSTLLAYMLTARAQRD